ncbi:uncharacterized protein LOC143910838 [Arctopsyche grandis]|uniref:uncharacterized protein LOC143910838 n=1 Tax=Arctopsyche grandis TaxID=121162 RepID=UPI00406DA305
MHHTTSEGPFLWLKLKDHNLALIHIKILRLRIESGVQRYKIDELDDDIPSHKSDLGSVLEEEISQRNSPISNDNRWRNSSASKPPTPIKSPKQDLTDEDPIDEHSPYSEQAQSPIIQNESEEETQTNSEEQRPKTPSTTEIRFINDNNQAETIEIEELNDYNGEERFINLKVESPHSVDDDDAPDIVRFPISDRSPAHSARSQILLPSAREGDNNRSLINSAPIITFLGSSVSTDEEVKSISSEISVIESPKPVEIDQVDKATTNGDIEIQEVVENKISPERKTPKKIINSRAVPKLLGSKLNRNKVQPVENEASATMLPFEKPKEALARSLAQLENPEWETVMTGLQSMGRLVKCHSSLMETQLTVATRAVASQVKNLRSQVARAACRLAGDMFKTHRKGLESEAEELAVPLLNRTADTNKFLRIDANDALDRMCEFITPQKSISILMTRGTVHQNAVVRCTSARLLANVVKSTGSDKIFALQKDLRDKLFQTGADLLTEGSLETRGHAKQLFKVLSNSGNFIKIMREVVPVSKYRNIEKTLNTLRTQ